MISSLAKYPYKLDLQKRLELLEITDSQDKPFLLSHVKNKNNIKLTKRLVLVTVRNARGKVYICQKKTQNEYGEWGIPTMGYVYAGESKEESASRLLKEKLNVSAPKLTQITSLPYQDKNGVNLHLSFFMAGPISQNIELNKNEYHTGLFVNAKELRAIIAHIPEAISTWLIWANASGWLFKK